MYKRKHMACSLQTQHQHGTPDEEEGEDSVITPMEEDVHPEGERRKLPAMVVARSSWREVALTEGGRSLREVIREGGRRRHQPQKATTETLTEMK